MHDDDFCYRISLAGKKLSKSTLPFLEKNLYPIRRRGRVIYDKPKTVSGGRQRAYNDRESGFFLHISTLKAVRVDFAAAAAAPPSARDAGTKVSRLRQRRRRSLSTIDIHSRARAECEPFANNAVTCGFVGSANWSKNNTVTNPNAGVRANVTQILLSLSHDYCYYRYSL